MAAFRAPPESHEMPHAKVNPCPDRLWHLIYHPHLPCTTGATPSGSPVTSSRPSTGRRIRAPCAPA